ncbi:Triose phosphate/phosphate translocator, chloroplastic [Hondaea fermentalgiana]|uniref:Triose phosphate/phosphate translocator, chloroplastic n=1 Tax=Hondaea fermentalgiana TaxID=2315210 RepID=A0A2R5G0A3_9STRA|nr:Triose phosphate/phosphate translocator, chloroplastic [Hondaea fermentalgiana]|eukprot:GBG24420.1 Triose phosphate/phosphate translocator, chloroplastic [Hondaea fermentalgiana]
MLGLDDVGSTMQTLFMCGVHMVVGPLLIVVNKEILTVFPYPFLLSSLGLVFTAIASHILFLTSKLELPHKEVVTPQFYMRNILPVGACHAATLAFGNAQYMFMGVAAVQFFKAFTPAVVTVFTRVLLKREVSLAVWGSLLLCCAGTSLTAVGASDISAVGILLAMGSSTSEAVRLVLTQFTLQECNFGTMEGQYFLTPGGAAFLLSLSAIYEGPRIIASGDLVQIINHPWKFLLAGCLGFVVQLVTMKVIKLTSSITVKVLSQFRNALVVFWGIFAYSEVVLSQQFGGYLLAVTGVLLLANVPYTMALVATLALASIGVGPAVAQAVPLVPPQAGAGGFALWLPNEDATLAGEVEHPEWGEELTVEMWAFIPSYALISQEYVLAELGTDWRLALNADGLVWQVQNDEVSKTHAEAEVLPGAWNHIAATYGPNNMSIIVNGDALPADCLPFNSTDSRDDPLYDSDVQLVSGLGLWCATVSRYTSGRADHWGFCDCPFLANSSYAARSGLVGDNLQTLGTLSPTDTRQVAYSASVDAINTTTMNFVVVDLEDNATSIPEQVRLARSAEQFSVLLVANRTIPTRDIVQEVADIGADMVLVLWTGEVALYPAIVNDGLTCLQTQRVQEASSGALGSSYRCASEGAALFGTDEYEGEASSQVDAATDCATYPFDTFDAANAFDADTSTSWIVEAPEEPLDESAEMLSLLYTYASPQNWSRVHRYALGKPSLDTASAPQAWTLEALVYDATGIYEDWVVLDEQSGLVWASEDEVRWFSIANATAKLGAGALVSSFRLRINAVSSSAAYVGLSELGVFASSATDTSNVDFYKDGIVNATSWYAPRNALLGLSLDIPVWALSATASPDAEDLLESIYAANAPASIDFVVTIAPYEASILSGRRPLPDRGTLTAGRGMIGVIDNLRVWNVTRSTSDIRTTAPLTFGTALTSSSDYEEAAEGLVLEWSMDELVSTPSSDYASAVCAAPLAADENYVSSSTSSATLVSGELAGGAALVPSSANLTGADMVVVLASTADRRIDVDLTGFVPSEPSNERYNVALHDRPSRGSLENVQLNDPDDLERDVLVSLGSLRYVRDRNVGSEVSDEFSFRLVASRSGTRYIARVVILFEPDVSLSIAEFQAEGGELAPLIVAWPQPGFEVAMATIDADLPTYRLAATTDTGGSFYVLAEADMVRSCLVENQGTSFARDAVLILDLISLDRSNLGDGVVSISISVEATRSSESTVASSLTVSAAVSVQDMEPIVPDETSLDFTEDTRSTGVSLQLESSTAQSIFRIQKWPAFYTLIQADSGETLAETSAASIQQFAAKTLRFSSQFASCDSCAIFGDPLCDIGKSCRASSSWSADQLVGAPDIYPDTRDDPRGWKPRRENGGSEFVELELSTAVFVSAVEVYEVLNPGSIMQIKVAAEYLDENSRCYQNITSGQNVCEDLTQWTTLWSQEESALASLSAGLKARIFIPDVCPSKLAVRYLRLELNTTQIPGWHVLDAIRVSGTSSLSPGLVTDASGKIRVRPIEGIFADDALEYTASDCQLESSNARVELLQEALTTGAQSTENVAASTDVFAQKPQILVPRGMNRTASVQSVPFEWDFLQEDLIERLEQSEGSTIPSSLQLGLAVEGGPVATILPSSATSTSAELTLAEILAPDRISSGEVSKVIIEATFQGFVVNDKEREALYRVEANLTLDCYQAFDDESQSLGRCAENRGVLAGECQDVWNTGRTLKTRRCSCYSDPALARLVAGEACELTMWNTCNGRGQPLVDTSTGNARCICFDDSLFGGQFCEKRSGPVASLEDLVAEVEAMKEEILLLVELDGLAVAVEEPFVALVLSEEGSDEESRRLLDEGYNESFAGYTTLAVFNLTEQMDPTDTCNDHGRPTSTGDCICDGFYEQPDCFTEASCEPGEYIVRVQNPQWTNTSDDSIPEEIGECRVCEPGYSCDSRVRTECEAGTFAHEAGMYACRDQCEDQGHFMELNASAINGIQCTICPLGSRCDGRNATLCEVGSFAPQEGLTQCILCNRISTKLYADTTGLAACLECPANTERINSDGVDISECVCEYEYWNGLAYDTNRTGVACQTCPENGHCPGNTKNAYDAAPPYANVSPFPLPGFWGDPAAPSRFFECEDAENCLGTDEFLCSNGTEGIFCFKCRDGWYSLGECNECPGGGGTAADAAFVIFCWGGVIAAWVILNILSNEVRALDLVLLYTQIVGIAQDFDLYWPDPVNLLNTPFEITGFEIDYFAPNCWWSSWSFINRFVLQFLMPIIYACLQGLVYYLGSLHVKYQQRRLERSPSEVTPPLPGKRSGGGISTTHSEQTILDRAEVGARLRERFGMLKAAAKRILLYFDLPDTEDDLASLRNKSIGLAFNFCFIAYPSLVVILLEPLSCIELADGSIVMQASPDIVCWESYHIYSLVIWSVLGILIYIIGIPALQLYILIIAESRDLKADPTFLERFGWMYSDFRQEVYKWECLLTFRRFAFAMILVVGSGDGYIQATIGCLVVVFCLALQVMHQPFLSRRLNILDQTGLFGSFLYIFLGVIFTAYNEESSALLEFSDPSTTVSILAWLLMLVTLGIVVLGMFISYLDARDYLRVVKAEAQLLMQGQTESVSLVRTVRRQADTRSVSDVMGILGNLNLAAASPAGQSPSSSGSPSSRGAALLGNVLLRGSSKAKNTDGSARTEKGWKLQNMLTKRASGASSSDLDSLTRSNPSLLGSAGNRSSTALEVGDEDSNGDGSGHLGLRDRVGASTAAGLDLEAQDDMEALPPLVAVPPGSNLSIHKAPPGVMMSPPQDESPVRSSMRSWFDLNWRPVLASLCARRWRSSHAPVIADPSLSSLFSKIDSDGTGTISRQELQDYITNELQMDGEAYRVQLDNLFGEYDVDQTGQIDKHEFAALINENVADLKRSELKNAIKSKHLTRWTLSDLCSPLQTTLFFELDAMSRNVIKNDGPVSVYRGTRMARFYRKLMRSYPFLLDWLMVADESDLHAFSRMIRQWQEAEDFVTHRGTLSRIVLPQYQAPFAFWMLNKATEKDRLVFQAVMTSILTASRPDLPVYENFRGTSGGLRGAYMNTSSAAATHRVKHEHEIAAARGIQRFYRQYKKRREMRQALMDAARLAEIADHEAYANRSYRSKDIGHDGGHDGGDDGDDDDDTQHSQDGGGSDSDANTSSDDENNDNDTITHEDVDEGEPKSLDSDDDDDSGSQGRDVALTLV